MNNNNKYWFLNLDNINQVEISEEEKLAKITWNNGKITYVKNEQYDTLHSFLAESHFIEICHSL
ncbi:MAG TPA: hypothetical protein V6C58_25875 [Allocoleopsis sp.]